MFRSTKKADGDAPRTKRAKRRDPIDEMYDDADEVPVKSVDELRKVGKKRFVWARRLLLASVPMNIFLGLMVLSLGAAYLNGIDEPPAAQEIRVTERGRTQAESALQDWLDRPGSAFAGSTIASWDGVSDRQNFPTVDNEPAFTELTHDFTIRTKAGTYLRASVRTAYTGSRGVKVVSTPTITAMAPTAVGEWDPEPTYPGWIMATSSQALTDAVNGWADAMTTSPSALKLAVRDEAPTHVYSTISGVDVTGVSIPQALTPADKNGAATDRSTVVATVTVSMVPEGKKPSDTSATEVQYDVLIRGADGGAPYVTAWGPAGSGTALKNYQNAASLSGQVDDSTNPSDGGGDDSSASSSGKEG